MVTTLYFIRHAEPNYTNHDDFSRELTKNGLQDSQELVKFFQQIKIDAFFSSPYKRAIDTITPLAQEKENRLQHSKTCVSEQSPITGLKTLQHTQSNSGKISLTH